MLTHILAPTCSGGLYVQKPGALCVSKGKLIMQLFNAVHWFIVFPCCSWVTASWHGEFSQVQIAELYGLNKKFRWELQGGRCK